MPMQAGIAAALHPHGIGKGCGETVRLRIGVVQLGVCLLMAAQPVLAAEGDTFTPYVGYGIYHDDNISRQPDDGVRSGDTWRKTTVGIRFDKEISRQRVRVDASLNDTKYDDFSRFDNDGRRLLANWNWVMGNRFSGNVGTSYIETLTPFNDVAADGTPLPSSVRTQRRSFANGGWHFHPAWRVTAGVSRDDVNYEDIPSARLSIDASEVGIDYIARSQNRIGLVLRHSDATYPNQLPGLGSDYTQDEVKANVKWRLTGKTDLQFLGGWARRRFDSQVGRDFTGPDARLTANWAATGKTSFTLAAWRELGSGIYRYDHEAIVGEPDDLSSNYSRNTGASIKANWQATAKMGFDAMLQSEDRDYNRIDRSDRYRKSTVGMTYLPLRQLNIRLSVYDQRLDSDATSATTYRTKGFQIATRYEF